MTFHTPPLRWRARSSATLLAVALVVALVLAPFAPSRAAARGESMHSARRARSAIDSSLITYDGLTFRLPAGKWARTDSPPAISLTRELSSVRLQRIMLWSVPVPEPLRTRTLGQHTEAFFELERTRERPTEEVWQGFVRGTRKVGDREFPTMSFTKAPRVADGNPPIGGMFLLYFPDDFADRQRFYCFAWFDVDVDREPPREDIGPLLELMSTVLPGPAPLVDEALARLLALPIRAARAPAVAVATARAEAASAVQQARHDRTYATQITLTPGQKTSAAILLRADVDSTGRYHVLQSSAGMFDEWISIGTETYRSVGAWLHMKSGEEALNRLFRIEKWLPTLADALPVTSGEVVTNEGRYLVLDYREALTPAFGLTFALTKEPASLRLWVDRSTHSLVRADVVVRDTLGDTVVVRQAFAGYGFRTRIEPPIVAASPASAADVLVGRWEWTRTSAGGIGNVLEFDTPEHFTFTYTVLINGTYRVRGDQLVRAVALPAARPTPSVPEDTVFFAVHGDSLLRWGGTRPDTLYATRTPDSPLRVGLPGRWTYPYAQFAPAFAKMPGANGANAFEDFASDGIFRFRLPLRPERLHARVLADTLFVEGAMVPEGKARWQWTVAGEFLSITTLDGPRSPPAVYVRAQAIR